MIARNFRLKKWRRRNNISPLIPTHNTVSIYMEDTRCTPEKGEKRIESIEEKRTDRRRMTKSIITADLTTSIHHPVSVSSILGKKEASPNEEEEEEARSGTKHIFRKRKKKGGTKKY